MLNNQQISMEQLKAVLDNAPAAIYVTAVDDWELLYVNRLAQRILGWGEFREGIYCYQAAGLESPCPFCQVSRMNREELLVRDFHSPRKDRIYQLSGKIIDWGGRAAHIEYFEDVTEKRREEQRNQTLRERIEAAFANVPCGLCVYRLEHGVIKPMFHNPAFYRVMGYSTEHIASVESSTEFLGVHPEDLEGLQAAIGQAIRENGEVTRIYRVWNDRDGAYRWIKLEGAVRPQTDGVKILYGIYSDVSKEQQLSNELAEMNEKMQAIVNAIPGGIAIYKVSDIFETVYFSDGVPKLSGYTSEEYRGLTRGDAAALTYREDTAMVVSKLREAIRNGTVADFEFRKQHRDGRIVWVRIQAKQVGEQDGFPLLHCVFHDISTLKKTQLQFDYMINSIPGGIVSYTVAGGRFTPTYVSEGVPRLTGHTMAEFMERTRRDAMVFVCENDRQRVREAVRAALETGEDMDVSYRVAHQNGNLIWVHLNGRRIGPYAETMEFYAVFSGMSAETRLFQSIADETADGIYVIDRASYEILYANESQRLFANNPHRVGEKCYRTLYGRSEPCAFCPLAKADGQEHVIEAETPDRFYTARTVETDWNGIPAYIQYVRDATEEIRTRREKERLEMYFQTLIKNLPGGVSVIRCEADGSMKSEFISDGFAALTRMPLEEAEALYGRDAFAGIHPEDAEPCRRKLSEYIRIGKGSCEYTMRLRCRDEYIWVKSDFSMLHAKDGVLRLYASYTDISGTMAEKEMLRSQYEENILRHYRTQNPDMLLLGHCNVTRDKILKMEDRIGSDLLAEFGSDRERFFTSLAGLVVEPEDRRRFLALYLNQPALEAFAGNDLEPTLNCFIKMPREEHGRYVQFKVNLLQEPHTGDVMGILTVRDITEQTMSERIMRQVAVESFDYVIDLDLDRDTYKLLASSRQARFVPKNTGKHSERVAEMSRSRVVEKDRARYAHLLDPGEIRARLAQRSSYTFAYALNARKGTVRTKTMTVSAVDMRLSRVCLVCADITESVRNLEQALAGAEEANRAKSDFLSAMSHDIRTPLNAIMGMTTLAAAHLDEKERIEDCLKKITLSSKHLLSLVNDILDMSKIERSKIVLNRMELSLHDVLDQLRSIMGPQAKSAGVRLQFRTGEISHEAFFGDSLRINQILINLLSNAIKFTPEGGSVEFFTEEIPAKTDAGRVRYRFTIADTGIGMSEEFLAEIFAPFVRSRTSAGIEGTGLGLSITKGLVDLMKGEISVDSREHCGSTFRVELEFEPSLTSADVLRRRPLARAADRIEEKPFRGRTFLIAEDNEINAEILCELLAMFGAQTVLKTDGAQTAAAFRDAAPGTFDAILMDIQMPVMNGYEATREIRKLPRAEAGTIPIVAMTANAFAEDIQAAWDAGMTAHVAKPVDLDVLRSTLESVLKTA